MTILNRSKPDGYTMAAINLPGQAVNQVVRGMKPDLRKLHLDRAAGIQTRTSSRPTTKKGMDQWTSFKQMKTAKKPIKAGITGTGGKHLPHLRHHRQSRGLPGGLHRRLQGTRADHRHHPRRHHHHQPAAGKALEPPRVQSGEARAIAVYLPERHPKFPDIPTGVEQGFRSWGRPPCGPEPLHAAAQGPLPRSPRCWRRPW